MIDIWDVDTGLAQLDKYFHSNDNHVIAGALLGVGIVNCGIKNDCDPVSSPIIILVYLYYKPDLLRHFINKLIFCCFQALALLADYLDKEDSSVKIGAINGLGLAYAGTQNEQVCHSISL